LIVVVVETELAMFGLISKCSRGLLCFEVLIIKRTRALLLFLRTPNHEGAAANIRGLVILLVLQDFYGATMLRMVDWADPEGGPLVLLRVEGVRIPESSTEGILLNRLVIVAPSEVNLLNST